MSFNKLLNETLADRKAFTLIDEDQLIKLLRIFYNAKDRKPPKKLDMLIDKLWAAPENGYDDVKDYMTMAYELGRKSK